MANDSVSIDRNKEKYDYYIKIKLYKLTLNYMRMSVVNRCTRVMLCNRKCKSVDPVDIDQSTGRHTGRPMKISIL